MLTVSLALNVLVLVPVTTGLLRECSWASQAFGPRTPARGILTAIYLAILVVSALVLGGTLAGVDGLVAPAAGLLTIQVAYKALSPFLVGDPLHPVVLSNLAIALIHVVTLVLIAPSVITA